MHTYAVNMLFMYYIRHFCKRKATIVLVSCKSDTAEVFVFSDYPRYTRTVPTLEQQRTEARYLLNDRFPADAFAAYYTLHHDPKRTDIFVNYDPLNRVNGFLTRAQTGLDLFRPVVVVRAAKDQVAASLFESGLQANRPYYLIAPLSLGGVIHRTLTVSDSEVLRVYHLDPNRFNSQINVLAVANRAPDGSPRFEIGSNNKIHARAGVNWRSPHFAEVYVYTEAEARGRGWGRSVLSALSVALLHDGLMPLYVVSEQNTASINLAESVGYVDSGAREFAAQVVRIEK